MPSWSLNWQYLWRHCWNLTQNQSKLFPYAVSNMSCPWLSSWFNIWMIRWALLWKSYCVKLIHVKINSHKQMCNSNQNKMKKKFVFIFKPTSNFVKKVQILFKLIDIACGACLYFGASEINLLKYQFWITEGGHIQSHCTYIRSYPGGGVRFQGSVK